MSRSKFIVLACFCAAFAAGASAGVAFTRLTARPHHGSWIAHNLDLTPEQREQMRVIWSGVMGSPREQAEQWRAIREERDEAIQALLSEEQKTRYKEVMQTYAEKLAALEAARRAAFEEAVERTKQILTESQRRKYEELWKQGPLGRGRRPGPPGGGPPRWDAGPPPRRAEEP